MPELPDVEHHRRVAERHAVGKAVRAVHVGDPAVVRNTAPQGLGRAPARATLATPQRTGKSVMDQSRIAGVGNLLSDEVCRQAMVHPATPCRRVDDTTWRRLAKALRRASWTSVSRSDRFPPSRAS